MVTVNDTLQNNSPKPLDRKYGFELSDSFRAYESISEANSTIPITYRHEGLTVLVKTDSVINEFWYKGGISDDKLVRKFENLYTLPTATASILGGVKVGSDLSIEDGVLNATSIINEGTEGRISFYTEDGKTLGETNENLIWDQVNSRLRVGREIDEGDFTIQSGGNLYVHGDATIKGATIYGQTDSSRLILNSTEGAKLAWFTTQSASIDGEGFRVYATENTISLGLHITKDNKFIIPTRALTAAGIRLATFDSVGALEHIPNGTAFQQLRVKSDAKGVEWFTPSEDEIILKSPNGTRFKVTVTNGGALSVNAV